MSKSALADQKIQRFRNRFEPRYGEGHYIFACQAAFLIGFTPNLLYQLWANFHDFPKEDGSTGTIDLIAVSDLLLSPLCRQTGRDIFEMEVEVRTRLLENLRTDRFATVNRLRDIAYFLFQFLDSNPVEAGYHTFRETLYWNTLVTLSPALAMEQLSNRLSDSIRHNDEGEIFRLRGLLEAFAYQDQGIEQVGKSDFFRLMNYTKALKASLLDYPQPIIDQQLRESGAWALTTKPGQARHSIKLPLLEKMVGRVEVPRPESELSIEVDLEVKEIFILLVGLDQYANFPSLTGCANDLEAVERILRKKLGNAPDWELYFHQLLNEQATAATVQDKLSGILDRAGPEDIVFFLFSGRAFKNPSLNNKTSLVFYDTQVEKTGEGEQIGAVSGTTDLEAILMEYPETSILLSIDTPHAAGLLEGSPAHVALLAAARPDEQSHETRFEEKTYGVFTFSLVRSLEEHPDFPSLEELIDSSREKIGSSFAQTPQLVSPTQNRYRRFLQETFFEDSEVFTRLEAARRSGDPVLDLAGLNLTAIPDELFRMAFLEKIDLSDNRLSTIPTELTLLVKLQSLNLAANRISRINLAVLNMSSLQQLKLQENPIAGIPREFLSDLERLRQYVADQQAGAKTMHLLMTGADEYQAYKHASLPGTEEELKTLVDLLADRFESDLSYRLSTVLLLGSEARRDNVLSNFQHLQSAAGGDTILFYFAGHDAYHEGENLLVMEDSQPPLTGSHELRAVDFQPLLQWAAGEDINLILINPPEGITATPPPNVVILDPGLLNNMQGKQGIFTATLLDILRQEEPVTFAELEGRFRLVGDQPKYSRSRTDKKYGFRLITDPINRNKRFLVDDLGPDRRIRERIREAAVNNARRLDLSGLGMTELPVEVLELRRLQELDLSGNAIRILPATLLQLSSLEKVQISGNPLLNLPPELLEAGNWKAVVDYFASIEAVEPGPPLLVFIFNEMVEELSSLPAELTEKLIPLDSEGLIRLEVLDNPRTEDLYRFFWANRHCAIEILNISTNGEGEGLVFNGESAPNVDDQTLTGLLVAPENVRLLISDANRSARWTAKMIRRGVGAAIGVRDSHSVAAAAGFWRGFYESLLAGLSIRDAFNAIKENFDLYGEFQSPNSR